MKQVLFAKNIYNIKDSLIQIFVLAFAFTISIWVALFLIIYFIWELYYSNTTIFFQDQSFYIKYAKFFRPKNEINIPFTKIKKIELNFISKSARDAMTSIIFYLTDSTKLEFYLGNNCNLKEMEELKIKLIELIGEKIEIV
jgi:hypothetical protein